MADPNSGKNTRADNQRSMGGLREIQASIRSGGKIRTISEQTDIGKQVVF